MTGQNINDYTFGNVLGRGGMATVYLAVNNKFQTPVAIKVLNKEFIYNDNIRSRFLAEAKKMYRMIHPHIIRVTDLIEQDDLVAFVMEYVEGPTLKEFLEARKNISDSDIKRMFGEMLDAVGYVHEQGIVHRDIKPSNFIISKKGHVKLLDFGIAKNTNADAAEYTMTLTTQNMGTPMYMSPEQVRDSKHVLPSSDIYSLGVVLWQMVTGRKPYNANTLSAFDIQTKIVREPLTKTETGWDPLIQKATMKESSDRYQDTRSFQKDIETAYPRMHDAKNLSSDDTTIIMNSGNFSPAGTYPPATKPANNKRTLIFVSSVVAVIVLIVVLIKVIPSGSSKKQAGYDTTMVTPVTGAATVNPDTAIYKDTEFVKPEATVTPPVINNPELTEAEAAYAKTVIRDFYDQENAGNIDALMGYYHFPLRRYFQAYNMDAVTLRSKIENSFSTTLYNHNMDIHWDSFRIYKREGGVYECHFGVTYGKSSRGEPMQYANHSLVIELNSSYKIIVIERGD